VYCDPVWSSQGEELSKAALHSFLHADFPNARRPESAQPVRTCWLIQAANALFGKVGQYGAETSARDNHIVCREYESDLIVAAFGVKKLAIGQHVGTLHENDFEPGGSLSRNHSPFVFAID